MKVTILVLEGPYNHQAADSAYQFTQSALSKGHEITGVFFYNDGVINANKLMDPPQDDRHIANQWRDLGEKGIDIVTCIAAGKRRGLIEENKSDNTRISGLGQLASMVQKSDRLITFGD